MSSNFNNAKIINVYYNKGDRKPYDVNGKPIAYIGEEFVGANEATELRFHFGEELDSASAIIVAKRANNDTRLDPLELVGTGVNSYFKVRLNAWYGEYKGKMTIIFKVYNGTVTYDDAENPTEITATTGQIIVSDIFNLEVAYAPNASSLVPPFETEDYDDWFFTLSTKLDKAQSITVVGALPTLTGDVYDDRYFYVEDEGTGRLYYINGSTAIEVVFQVGTLKLTPTGNGDITANTGKLFWNQPNGTVNVGLYNDVYASIGEDVFYYVKASGAITKGDVIQYAGYQGDHALAKRAVQAEVNANPKLIMGIAKNDITNGDFGYVAHFGKIESVDTKSQAVNSFVYFDSAGATAGNWTITQPTAPNAKILLGVIIKAETSANANNGVILVRPIIEPSIKELQDVNITSIANNQVLRWNNTNLRWENTSALTTAETDIDALEGRMTTEEGNVDSLEGRMTTAETDITNIENGTTIVAKALADQNGNVINTTYLTQGSATATYIPLSQKGVANGVAPLGSDNKILSIHLPGGVDDVKEFANEASLPLVGEASIIYVTLDTNKAYRWGGSAYVEISASLALGSTASTAFRGDLGVALETTVGVIAPQVAGIIDGTQTLTDTRITNSAVATIPSIVNAIASTTADLQQWQVNGVNQAFVSSNGRLNSLGLANNVSGPNSSFLSTGTTGAIISRNVNDANVPLIVRKQQGTGNILELQTGTSDKKFEVDVNGWFYQNGTRLFTQTGAATTNNFLGINSGGSGTTGAFNTSIGSISMQSLTTGAINTAIGYASLNALTTGSQNTSIGADSGRSITTGSTNTIIGMNAGYNASQLVSASNSTALGFGSFTDKSNQMVFGNASVTEFKFDRNASALLLAPQISATSPNLHLIERTATTTNDYGSVYFTKRTTTADMVDGFGVGINFQVRDSANVDNTLANFGAIRSGADNSGRLSFSTANAGSTTEKMTILPNGNVGIGTASPATLLSVVTSSNTDGLQIRRNSVVANDYALLGFRINTTEAPNNFAEIRGVRTNRVAGGDSDLRFATFSNGTLAERLIIRDDGNVGIGTGSPATTLSVVATTNTSGIQIRRNSTTTNDYALLGFRISTTELADNIAEIRAVRTNRAVGSDTDLRLFTHSNNVLIEAIRIRDDGLVGINETSPSAQLQVKSGATNRVPLIVDTLASHAEQLQLYRVNGTNVARVSPEGFFVGSGIFNLGASNNALVSTATTGTTISRNIADTNPALIVNLANAGATGNIQVWQKAGVAQAWVNGSGELVATAILNKASFQNSLITLGNAGTLIYRSSSDANVVLKVQQNSTSTTGNLQEWILGASSVVASVNKDGLSNFTGTLSNEQTGDYTLVLADKGKVLRVNSSTNRTVTIPLNSSVAFPIDTEIAILRYGTGTVSISPTSGVTLNSKNSERKISGQYGSVALKKIGTDEWVLVGSLEA